LALEKPAPKATRLFQFAGFFLWKAKKSSNKHPLDFEVNDITKLNALEDNFELKG
jgi:hypothetical protein